MRKNVKQHANKGISALLITLFLFSSNVFARTQVIEATINSIEPIYMNYNIKKISQPCQAVTLSGCWNITYQKRVLKILQGYRIKLYYKGQQFTTRMRVKPKGEQLKIRVSGDLLGQPNNVAVNAAVAY